MSGKRSFGVNGRAESSGQSLLEILCEIGDQALAAASGHTLSMLLTELLSDGRYLPVRDFVRLAATPHVYDQRMEEFYKVTEAYIPGLLRWHFSLERILLRRQMLEVLAAVSGENRRQPLQVVCFGDGIGIDSLVLARRGYNVTYYDWEGVTMRFARLLFERFEVPVKLVAAPQPLDEASADCVLSFDVIEHLPEPQKFVTEIRGLLKPSGLAFITEAFGWLEPYAVSHLAANIRFVGKLHKMFAASGLQTLKRVAGSRLHVFSKAQQEELRIQRRLAGYSGWALWQARSIEKIELWKSRLRGRYRFDPQALAKRATHREILLGYGAALEAAMDSNRDPEQSLELLLGTDPAFRVAKP